MTPFRYTRDRCAKYDETIPHYLRLATDPEGILHWHRLQLPGFSADPIAPDPEKVSLGNETLRTLREKAWARGFTRFTVAELFGRSLTYVERRIYGHAAFTEWEFGAFCELAGVDAKSYLQGVA